MLRLELQARVANLQAEAGAIAAEAAVDSGTPIDLPDIDPSVVADAALPAEDESSSPEPAAVATDAATDDEVPPA